MKYHFFYKNYRSFFEFYPFCLNLNKKYILLTENYKVNIINHLQHPPITNLQLPHFQ